MGNIRFGYNNAPCMIKDCDGVYTEVFFQDDMDGTLHCYKCHNRIKRISDYDEKLPCESCKIKSKTIWELRGKISDVVTLIESLKL